MKKEDYIGKFGEFAIEMAEFLSAENGSKLDYSNNTMVNYWISILSKPPYNKIFHPIKIKSSQGGENSWGSKY